jgi:UDP-sugar transporter A1/2/3
MNSVYRLQHHPQQRLSISNCIFFFLIMSSRLSSSSSHHHHHHPTLNQRSRGGGGVGGGTGSADNSVILIDHHDVDANKDDSIDEILDRTETAALLSSSSLTSNGIHKKVAAASTASSSSASSVITRTGLMVLILLAVQNCSKNLLMRYVMKDRPKFLTSAAVLGSEFLKLSASVCYICFYERKSLRSIPHFLFRHDLRNTLLLAVPASAYNLQMSLEYVALANLDAAVFSVLVQTKLLFTATFAAIVLQKQLKYIQVISLLLLTTGVMLCNLNPENNNNTQDLYNHAWKGIMATLGIAVSSGFASVYTEKVIKALRKPAAVMVETTTTTANANSENNDQEDNNKKPIPTVAAAESSSSSSSSSSSYGLAYTQVQLAFMSLVTIGVYACLKDWHTIRRFGLFHNFTASAFVTILNSALGGLIVAGVLKYADSVLKGYATAMSVILTGVLSMLLFGTSLSIIYFMGIINVVIAVLLYNGKDLESYVVFGNNKTIVNTTTTTTPFISPTSITMTTMPKP